MIFTHRCRECTLMILLKPGVCPGCTEEIMKAKAAQPMRIIEDIDLVDYDLRSGRMRVHWRGKDWLIPEYVMHEGREATIRYLMDMKLEVRYERVLQRLGAG